MSNLNWKAQSVVVGGIVITLSILTILKTQASFYSERDYGRFGSYFKSAVTPENPLSVKYRLILEISHYHPKNVSNIQKIFLPEVGKI